MPHDQGGAQRRRRGADAKRAVGCADCRGGGKGRFRAGYGEVPSGLGPGQPLCCGVGSGRGRRGRTGDCGSWPDPGHAVFRRGGLGYHPSGQAGGCHSGNCQWRHFFRGGRSAVPKAVCSGFSHAGARRVWRSLALPGGERRFGGAADSPQATLGSQDGYGFGAASLGPAR